jgi:hypothetical protein
LDSFGKVLVVFIPNYCKMRKLFTYILILLSVYIGFVEPVKASDTAIPQEEEYNPTNIEFEVRLTAPRRFAVIFENPDGNSIYVKVYDMVGNQVAQEISNHKGRFAKEFDMSSSRSEVFIVEVGNARINNTKRVFLQK